MCVRLWGAVWLTSALPSLFFSLFFFFFFFLLDGEGAISFGKFGRDAHVSGHAATDLHY